ncbi:transmembrane protein 131 [Anopheles maculipalpis]|uniref:transmembrane protein 131 n=1 Tax=Anopheles maculipalpis TaxID=1496333 RepID=UPI002158BDE8|nr:transmembrane protein 131 [Anopheles maculipalpis]
MFSVGSEENHGRTSRSNNNSRHHRWTARFLGLVLLVLLQLESQVHFPPVAATPEDTSSTSASPSSATSSSSTSSSPRATQSGVGATSGSQSGSSSLIDGIILDENSLLLSAGPKILSEEAATHLFFHPPQLNFADRSIGDPHNQLVVLFNRHKNRSVYLGSISGSTAEFSSSYFKEKVIPPGGNTSFNVVFLPRKLGPADGSLLVHTSFGMLRYVVQGEGIECPYRLRPLVGLQAPLNATLSPEITLYNPHDTPLQIVEVYSSGGSFQLELPSGAQEGPQALWEIPPHSTRTVIRVRFHARTPGNHIAYVRIKISGGAANPSLVDKMLVVPIEVEISKETGLYSRIPFLELGIASSLSGAEMVSSTAARRTTTAATALAASVDDSEFGLSVRNGRNVTRLSLDLYNSGSQVVRVKSWVVQADDVESVRCLQVLVADGPTLHVEFDWSKLSSDRRHISGRILLKLERILSSSEEGEQAMGDEEETEEDGDHHQQQHQQEELQSPEESTSRSTYKYEQGVIRTSTNEYEGGTATTTEEGGAEGAERAKVVPSVYYIPFAGEVLKGSIQYNEEALRFLLPSSQHDQGTSSDGKMDKEEERGRPLVVRNHFNVPLSITNISVPENCSRYFAIENFRPVVLQPNDERTLLRIHRMAGVYHRLLNTYFTSLRLATNISDYELPVLGYSGRLERLLSPTVRDASLLTPTRLVQPSKMAVAEVDGDSQELDFGVLPIATIGEALVAFRNPNPIPIPIIHWKGAITSEAAVGAPTITVILRGCGPLRLDGLVFCHTVQPGEWIVYQISVQSGTIDSYQGRFTVKTDYEEIVTPLRFTTAVGELHLMRERLRFDDCFPGKLCSLSLLAASSFPTKIQIESIRTDVPGLSYEFLSPDKQRPLAPNQPVALYPDTVTSIGRLTLDPKAHCGPSDCYSSFDLLSKPFGVKWMATLDCYEQYRRLDSDKLLQQLQQYAEMRQRLTSVHFQVLAESSRRFDFNASVGLVWPKLLDENVFFPTLQVEQEAVRLITINNPSDQILFVHLVLHDVALHGRQPIVDGGGGAGGGINLPPEVLTACDNCTLSEESVFSFFLFDSDDIYVNYVKPQSFLRIAIKFSAQLPGTYSTVLYMRNNLTLIDAAWIQARAVVPLFKFGNRRPGSPTALQFEITEKHAQPCYDRYYRQLRSEGRLREYEIDAEGHRHEVVRQDEEAASTGAEKEKKDFMVETRRTFTARNYGEVPILVSAIRIEETPCEGFGFKVLDCTPFELAPNASRKIEIAFAPDFTLSRVVRTLHFDTNINQFSVNFTLLGTVPMHRLDVCNRALPRPWFEYWFRAVLFVVLPTVLFGTLAVAVLDSNRVLRIHFLSLVREKGPLQPPLDLRQIALQHSNSNSAEMAGNTGGGKESTGRVTVGSASHNGSVLNSSSTVISRNNRKPERKNGTHSKGTGGVGGGAFQNGSASSVASSGESASSRFNRSWTDFTIKLGATAKPILAASPTGQKALSGSLLERALPASLSKSRRSITPSKDQQQQQSQSSEVNSQPAPTTSDNTGAPTKDRTKASSPTSISETESLKNVKNGPLFGGKSGSPSSTSTSDLTGVLESNSTASSKQHHHSTSSSSSLSSSSSSSVTAAEEQPVDVRHISSTTGSMSLSSSSTCSSSSSSSSGSSTTSSSSSSPSPTSKQQHYHQSKQQSATTTPATATTKTSVKKTKSLPPAVSYESVVVSLASVFAVTSSELARSGNTITTYTSQKPAAEVTTSTVVTNSSIASPTAAKDGVQMSSKETAPSKVRTGASIGANGKQLLSASNGNGTTKSSVTSANKQQESSVNCMKTGSEKINPFSGASGTADSVGKENSSSGNIISQQEKLTIGNGNSTQAIESSLQQQHQPQSKKFSKTPGRERKPNQSKKGTNGGKGGTATGYKGTALQFNTPAQQQHKSITLGTLLQNASVPVPSTGATVWGENCARFSDVVAQTPAITTSTKSLAGGKQSTVSSIMEALPWLSAVSGSSQSADKSLNHARSHANNASYGTSSAVSTATGSAQNYRKSLHSHQDSMTNGLTTSNTSGSNRTEQKAKDDSYIGGTLEKECSAPFVATSASPDLGPIGTSKKSPTGANGADGDGEEIDGMMGHMGRLGSNVANCWEPFVGPVIHNPSQLASGGSGCDSGGKTMNGGGQQSDSFFSQSFADYPHRQSDQYRGIASMARGSTGMMNGITTSSLLSIAAGHPFTTANGGANQQTEGSAGSSGGTVENDFMEAHFHSSGQQQQQQHLQHQQHQQQHNNHHHGGWNNTSTMDDGHLSQWSLSSHKPLSSTQSSGMNQSWRSTDLWNNLNAQHQYQQQQQQQQMAYESVLHFHSQLAMAAAGANQLPGTSHPLQQHQPQPVPDVRLAHRASNLNDAWLGSGGMTSGQTTVAPPPGFSNHHGLSSSRIVYQDHQQQAYNMLLQHRFQQQQQQQQQQSQQPQQPQQQQLIRQLSSEEPSGASSSGSVSASSTVDSSSGGQTSGATAVASSTTSTSGTSTSGSSSSTSSTYNPFQLPSIWSPANNIDVWAASAGPSEEL